MEVSGHALMHDAEKPAAKLKQIAAQVKSETAVPPRAGSLPESAQKWRQWLAL